MKGKKNSKASKTGLDQMRLSLETQTRVAEALELERDRAYDDFEMSQVREGEGGREGGEEGGTVGRGREGRREGGEREGEREGGKDRGEREGGRGVGRRGEGGEREGGREGGRESDERILRKGGRI